MHPAIGRSRPVGAGGMPRAADLIGAGNLTVTLETDDGAQRYQGIVPITGDRLADSLQVYFENSEQLPTRLWLYADESRSLRHAACSGFQPTAARRSRLFRRSMMRGGACS